MWANVWCDFTFPSQVDMKSILYLKGHFAKMLKVYEHKIAIALANT